MLVSLKALLLFALSGFIASLLGGFIAFFLLLGWSTGFRNLIPVAFLSAMWGPGVGAVFATIPAALVGAVIHLTAASNRRLDNVLVWFGAGAITGLGIFAYFEPSLGVPGPDAPEAPGQFSTACCLAAAGGVAALMFRHTAAILSEFLPLFEDP